ncbi:hypothetical protein QJQ45_028822, partial [Haematococcus lacustris]
LACSETYAWMKLQVWMTTSIEAETDLTATRAMAAQGAALQSQNNELVKCIDDLREKREEIIKQIKDDEQEKNKIQQDLQILTKRLAQVNESIARKNETSGGASNKRRVEENNYGPVLPSERGSPVPEALQRAVRRRFGLFLTTSRTPFRAVDNEHLQAIFDMLGVDLHKETFYRTTQLEDLHREVKELTVKQLVKLLQDGFVICSDGWRYKFAGKGAPLVNFILLKPDGGVLFIKVVDVSGKRKDAVAIKDQHLELAGLVSGDCEAIRTELADQQMKMHVRNVHSIRANNPTRFAGLLLMAKDMQVIMGAIVGMTTSVSWEQLRSSSVNATVFDRLTLVAAFKRRAEMHYAPVHAAAYVVDPAHFKPPRAGVHARPPFMDLTPKQLEDTIDTVARLSKASTAAVRKELTDLKLGVWSDDMVRDVAGIQEQTRTSEDGKTVAADISVRRGLWDFTAREDYPLFSEAATRLLSMHITTAAAERNWSAWGDTFEAGRAQLGIKKAEMMVYIHANIPKGASAMPSELVALGITAFLPKVHSCFTLSGANEHRREHNKMSSASALKQAAQAEDYAVSESRSLLQNQPDSSSVAHPPIVFGTVHSEEVIQAYDDSELPCWVWMTTSIEAETGDYYNVNSTLCIWHAQTTAVVMQHVKCR